MRYTAYTVYTAAAKPTYERNVEIMKDRASSMERAPSESATSCVPCARVQGPCAPVPVCPAFFPAPTGERCLLHVRTGSKTPGGAGTHTRQTQEPHKPTFYVNGTNLFYVNGRTYFT
jgi:hypothetical protein